MLAEVADMNNMDEVIQAISTSLIVAYFLLNTNRVLKSIELCKECLVIFKQRAGIRNDELAKSLHKGIYLMMSNAYRAINDNTSAIKYTEKILQIYRGSGEKLQERALSSKLAKLYYSQSKYAEARDLWEKALIISTEISDRNGEAACYGNLGAVYQTVG